MIKSSGGWRATGRHSSVVIDFGFVPYIDKAMIDRAVALARKPA
jgi:anti-anti-sigma regulatory factor